MRPHIVECLALDCDRGLAFESRLDGFDICRHQVRFRNRAKFLAPRKRLERADDIAQPELEIVSVFERYHERLRLQQRQAWIRDLFCPGRLYYCAGIYGASSRRFAAPMSQHGHRAGCSCGDTGLRC